MALITSYGVANLVQPRAFLGFENQTAMGAVAMTTVRFLTQMIQMNSSLLTAMIDVTKLQYCV